MSQPLKRVLIVAENASTRLGGEAIIPYHIFRLLRQRGVDAHLIVHERMRTELETLFLHDLDHLHFVADQSLQKLFYRIGRVLPRRIDEATLGLANQMLTQRSQHGIVRRLSTAGAVLHQPIPVSPRFPSMMSGLGMPLVVGPLNGGMEYPVAFRGSEALLSRLTISFGRALTDVMNALFPGKRNAAVVLVANERTRLALPSGLKGSVIELPENGVDPSQWETDSASTPATGRRFVFVGRLVDWKALDIALDALTCVPEATLDVIGEGPMRVLWEAHATRVGLQERVRFHGWMKQADCAAYLIGANALLLPSIYECGGAVVLEAMAMQVPVVATAWGGPLDYLNAECGYLVEPSNRDALVNGFAAAMIELADSPELCAEMGSAGQKRLLEHFDWNRKIDRLLDIYTQALGPA